MIFFFTKAEDPILEFCSFNFVVVNMWFASIFQYLFFCIFMVFILPRVILLLLNRDVRHLVIYYAVWSKLLAIRGFSMHRDNFLHQGTRSVEWKTLVAFEALHQCVIKRVCMYARVTVCMFWCMYASVLTL